MKRQLAMCVLGVAAIGVLAGCLAETLLTPESHSALGWDHAASVGYLEDVFEPMLPLLEQTGDTLDFERFRFFSGKDLNGEDETVVIIPLTIDSPSTKLAFMSEEEAPLEEIAPLPMCGFLALDPCTCFHTIENGVPYLYRIRGYDVQAELVDIEGSFIRSSTEFAWEHRGDPIKGEELTFRGNIYVHMEWCAEACTNQK